MKRSVRTIAAIGLLGTAAFGIGSFGCGNRLGPVRATQNGGIGRPNFPDITVEHAKDCVAVYAPQLPPGYHVLNSSVLVDEDGDKINVTINDIPNTAPDFGACLRKTLSDMPVSEDLIRQGAAELNSWRDQASAEQRSLVGSPVVVVAGVVIVVSELFLEAGAYTILFAVTVKVVDKAKDDVLDALKRIPITDGDEEKDDCVSRFVQCTETAAGMRRGNHWNISVCGTCADVCKNKGKWPSHIPSSGRGMLPCY